MFLEKFPYRVKFYTKAGRAFGVHSEHDLKEQSDAQIIVSRFPFRGEGS